MKKLRFFGLLVTVVLLAFGLALGCSNGSTDDDDDNATAVSSTYSGKTDTGQDVEVVFSNKTIAAKARAAGPQNNDNYVISLGESEISRGRVAVSGSVIDFYPDSGEGFQGQLINGVLSISGVPGPSGALNVQAMAAGSGLTPGGNSGGNGSGILVPKTTVTDALKGAAGATPGYGSDAGSIVFSGKVSVGGDDIVAVPVIVSGGATNAPVELYVKDGATYTVATVGAAPSGFTVKDLQTLVKTGGGSLVIEAPFTFGDRPPASPGVDLGVDSAVNLVVKEGTVELVGQSVHYGGKSNVEVSGGKFVINDGKFWVGNHAVAPLPPDLTGGFIDVNGTGELIVRNGATLMISGDSAQGRIRGDGKLTVTEGAIVNLGSGDDNPQLTISNNATMIISSPYIDNPSYLKISGTTNVVNRAQLTVAGNGKVVVNAPYSLATYGGGRSLKVENDAVVTVGNGTGVAEFTVYPDVLGWFAASATTSPAPTQGVTFRDKSELMIGDGGTVTVNNNNPAVFDVAGSKFTVARGGTFFVPGNGANLLQVPVVIGGFGLPNPVYTDFIVDGDVYIQNDEVSVTSLNFVINGTFRVGADWYPTSYYNGTKTIASIGTDVPTEATVTGYKGILLLDAGVIAVVNGVLDVGAIRGNSQAATSVGTLGELATVAGSLIRVNDGGKVKLPYQDGNTGGILGIASALGKIDFLKGGELILKTMIQPTGVPSPIPYDYPMIGKRDTQVDAYSGRSATVIGTYTANGTNGAAADFVVGEGNSSKVVLNGTNTTIDIEGNVSLWGALPNAAGQRRIVVYANAVKGVPPLVVNGTLTIETGSILYVGPTSTVSGVGRILVENNGVLALNNAVGSAPNNLTGITVSRLDFATGGVLITGLTHTENNTTFYGLLDGVATSTAGTTGLRAPSGGYSSVTGGTSSVSVYPW